MVPTGEEVKGRGWRGKLWSMSLGSMTIMTRLKRAIRIIGDPRSFVGLTEARALV